MCACAGKKHNDIALSLQALHRRRERLRQAGIEATRENCSAPHVVHVSLDGRKVFLGDEHDVTANGGNIMAFNKAWKSGPIQATSLLPCRLCG